jgi:hypothetical protein
MTEALVCGHPTPNGPCTRKVIPGAGGCGFHPAPADPESERHPEPAPTCECERPYVGARSDNGDPPRCWWCARPVAKLLAEEGGPGKVTDERTDPADRLHPVSDSIAAKGAWLRALSAFRDEHGREPTAEEANGLAGLEPSASPPEKPQDPAPLDRSRRLKRPASGIGR